MGTAERRARRQGRDAGCGEGVHIMSAGSLPAMYGGVSIAISYAKHPAHRHNPHGATHAWHGRAQTKRSRRRGRPAVATRLALSGAG